jgi:hypothetical protein
VANDAASESGNSTFLDDYRVRFACEHWCLLRLVFLVRLLWHPESPNYYVL